MSTPSLADLIPLSEVPSRLPTNPDRSTVYRWAQDGRAGIRLRTVSAGSTRCTTEAWLMDFFEQVEKARQAGPAARRVARAPRRPRTSRASRMLSN
jgi:hypothetical protein